uniref:Uncharacterized protein n=1 Tax=Panagrellus redivivus TaxID=6233 RepID=A0A7E4V1F0_PANRE
MNEECFGHKYKPSADITDMPNPGHMQAKNATNMAMLALSKSGPCRAGLSFIGQRNRFLIADALRAAWRVMATSWRGFIGRYG